MALGFDELAEKTKTMFTVNHLAVNGFAPVDKILEYDTITIPTTPGIVWLDRNLGAERRPLSLTDVSDQSRGWFWQFNRKQGYEFKAGVRTPATAPDKLIIEDYDWLPENDPCQELGEGWRLPTKQEWDAYKQSIPTGRSQSTYHWKYGLLKLHQPGWFYTSYNKLYGQGNIGKFWTSQRGGASVEEYAYYLQFTSGNVATSWMSKTYGASIRAVKDI